MQCLRRLCGCDASSYAKRRWSSVKCMFAFHLPRGVSRFCHTSADKLKMLLVSSDIARGNEMRPHNAAMPCCQSMLRSSATMRCCYMQPQCNALMNCCMTRMQGLQPHATQRDANSNANTMRCTSKELQCYAMLQCNAAMRCCHAVL